MREVSGGEKKRNPAEEGEKRRKMLVEGGRERGKVRLMEKDEGGGREKGRGN